MFPKPVAKRRRPWRAATDDPVTPELRAFVLARDRVCLGVPAGYPHECRGEDGKPHLYSETSKLSVEHVHLDGSGTGRRRAPSTPVNCFALCYGLNVGGTPAIIRRWLRNVYVPALTRVG